MHIAQFHEILGRMINPQQLAEACQAHAPCPRGVPKLSAVQVVESLVFHQLQDGGTLAEHGAQLHGVKMSDAAYSQRRENLPMQLFEDITRLALAPVADPARHADDCFFEGLRLIGVDGSQFSVLNTPAILGQLDKAATRRLKAAFAKVRLVCAVELGTHAPVAAVVAPASEGEQTLARRLWGQLPGDSLTIMDRLFGTARTLAEAIDASAGSNCYFLVRVRENIRVTILQRLHDGSAVVEVPVRIDGKIVSTLRVREICARIVGRDGKAFTLRLWTTLLDAQRYPAERLARQYAERWEAELYLRELKLDVRTCPVLSSHTVQTALQEVLALVLASAVVAHLRVDAAEGLQLPPRRVSFLKILMATRKLWETCQVVGPEMTEALRVRIWKQYLEAAHYAILPARRERSCPRVMRQRIGKWPRKLAQPSFTGPVSLEVVPV